MSQAGANWRKSGSHAGSRERARIYHLASIFSLAGRCEDEIAQCDVISQAVEPVIIHESIELVVAVRCLDYLSAQRKLGTRGRREIINMG
jgi:hypothetical protein